MNKYEIIKKIENFAPPQSAQEWDCIGFMTETENVDIKKIMLCLTPTKNIIKQAIQLNCDMIISHHPMFQVELCNELITKDFKPRIDIYSAHTNLDIANGGTTDTLIKSINFPTTYLLENNKDDFVRYIKLDKPIEVNALAQLLRKISPNLRYTNNNNIKTVQKIGFCAGSGADFINSAQENGTDCFITGDLKFHTAIEAEIVLFDIGHFDSEILILPVLKKIIGNDVEVVFAKEKNPFLY